MSIRWSVTPGDTYAVILPGKPIRELQRWIDGDIFFRNPLPRGLLSHRRRTPKPILQLQSGFPQCALLQQCHQVQHVSACPARETVKNLALHIDVKGIAPVTPVDGTPPTIATSAATLQIVNLVMPQHRFHRHPLFDGGEVHLLALHAATS
jgi:hypothetical protein